MNVPRRLLAACIPAILLATAACTSLLGDFSTGSSGPDGSVDGNVDATGPGESSVGDSQVEAAADSMEVADATAEGSADALSESAADVVTDVATMEEASMEASTKDAPEEASPCVSPNLVCSGTCTVQSSNNCGSCGRTCGGGACKVGSGCQPLLWVTASLPTSLTDFASDGVVVVWADGNNTIDEVLTAGAASKIVLAGATIVSGARNVAISQSGNGAIAWTQYNTTSVTTGMGFASEGTAGSGAIATNPSGVTNGLVFDANGTDVYTQNEVTASSLLRLLSCSAGNACFQLYAVPVASTQGAFDVAYGGGYVLFADTANSVVYQVPAAGGTTVAVTGEPTAYHLAASGTSAFWVTGSNQTQLVSASLGKTATTNVTNAAGTPLATDGTYVYFPGNNGADLDYVPVGGGTVQTLVAGAQPDILKVVQGAGSSPSRVFYSSGNAVYSIVAP